MYRIRDLLLASAILEKSARKLRSAVGDEIVKHLNYTGDLGEMMEALEAIRPLLEDAEMRSVGEEGDLGEMMEALEAIRPLLEDAEMRSVGEEPVRDWFRELKTSAYGIEDMVDELQDARTPAAGTMRRMLPCLANKKNPMAKKIKEMKAKLNMLQEESCGFGFTPSGASVQQVIDVPETTEVEEPKIVGMDTEKKIILHLLKTMRGVPSILGIVGPGGIGKTTLAAMVFDDTQCQQEYHFRVWVHVSDEFDKISESIISQVSGEEEISCGSDGETEEYMTKRLQELFNGMNVLVVLDDVMDNDYHKWELLNCMLSVGHKMTVIVTTRSVSVCASARCSDVYTQKPLDMEMSRQLLKLTSCFEDRSDKQELEEIREKILKMCMGIPLLIHAVGGMLRYKDARGWLAAMEGYGDDFFSVLMLIYRLMPPNLRLCFAYCGSLPFGHSIAKYDLINQWIALDLIEPSDGFSTTQIGEEYIRRLLGMSFLQPTKLASTSGKDDKGAIFFTMHDIAHDLAISVMSEELIILDHRRGTEYQNKCYRYALLTNFDVMPSGILSAKLSALRWLDCSKMELSDGFFSFGRCLRVLDLKERSMHKLPDSICHLRQLRYLNLSGCTGLVKLPQSFGDLVNLLHVDLSRCTRLVNLPESFGGLVNLRHVNLSRCYGLEELLGSFSNLKEIVYLDLSFCSSFEGISTVLGGLTNLEHLNLSYPCCYVAEYKHLMALNSVLGKLTKLRYLNLSMFLNPIFYQLPENESLKKYIECISGLSSLKHLDLSHNIFLVDLPENLAKLNKLHTLDLSGCARLERVDKWMGEMVSLKLIVVRDCQGLESYQFVVRADGRNSNFDQLKDISCKELEISCLENVKSVSEAQKMGLVKKEQLERLKLCWTVDSQRSVEDNDLLAKLQPPHNLQCLELYGYIGETCLPAWWPPSISSSHLPNLVKVIMEDLPMCRSLPPLGLLPNLQEVVLRRMPTITRIDASDLSGSNTVAFSRLTKFTIAEMHSLEEFNFSSGGEKFILPELVIQKCSRLNFGLIPPRAQRLQISDCDQLMTSWPNRGHGVEGSSTPVTTELIVESCNVRLADWSLLHRFPGLHSLTIKNCNDVDISSKEIIQVLSSLHTLCFSDCHSLPQELGRLTSLKELQIVCCKQLNCLPDSMQKLTSLESMHLTDCESITELPGWFKDLESLQKISIDKCHAIKSLPSTIPELKKLEDLEILNCPELKRWCEENREKLANIRLKYELNAASSQNPKEYLGSLRLSQRIS